MRTLIFVLFFGHLFKLADLAALPASQTAEQTLVTNLLTGYNKNTRPSSQVSVEISATLQQIVSMDEKQQIMTSSSFISQTWSDIRLSWTPSTASNIDVLTLPAKSIWTPDTMILNSADTSGYLSITDYSLVSVNYSGQVYMILPALAIKTRCNLFVQNFPFDRQVCNINLTSWGQGTNRVTYAESDVSNIDLSAYTEHPLWQLERIDLLTTTAEDRIPFENTNNQIISIQLFLHRKPLFFIVNGIFACLILNCVTLISYALPFGSQIGLCMTCFMTYSVYSLSFSNLFPQQSQYLMMITLYFLLSISATLLSMAWFVLCNHFISKGEMPKVLDVLCGPLQKVFFCCAPPPNKVDSTSATADEKLFVQVGDAGKKDVAVKNKSADDNGAELGKAKCDFCNRCEPCQEDFDKDKAKGKKKKDVEAKCSTLNYLVFLLILLFIFISNLVVWIVMSR